MWSRLERTFPAHGATIPPGLPRRTPTAGKRVRATALWGVPSLGRHAVLEGADSSPPSAQARWVGSSVLTHPGRQLRELIVQRPSGGTDVRSVPTRVREPTLSPPSDAVQRGVPVSELDAAARAHVVRRIGPGGSPRSVVETLQAEATDEAEPGCFRTLAFHAHRTRLPAMRALSTAQNDDRPLDASCCGPI
jgi:hypothetical protein